MYVEGVSTVLYGVGERGGTCDDTPQGGEYSGVRRECECLAGSRTGGHLCDHRVDIATVLDVDTEDAPPNARKPVPGPWRAKDWVRALVKGNVRGQMGRCKHPNMGKREGARTLIWARGKVQEP